MNAYDFEDYKEALKTLLNSRKAQFGSRFTFERMAAACGIQKTYLSKVMNGGGQLNGDQLYSACEFLKLPFEETEYLLDLRDWQLSQNKTRAERIKAKLEEIKKRHLKTESSIVVSQEQSVQNQLWEYYTDIDLQLTHLFLTVPQFSENSSAITEKIGISEDRLKNILLKLQNWKIVRYEKGKYVADNPKLHLSEDSPAFITFGILNRIKTLEKLRKRDSEITNEYFFSVFFSAETAFQNRFKKKLLELLKETQTQVVASKPQEVYQLNIDFFRWS